MKHPRPLIHILYKSSGKREKAEPYGANQGALDPFPDIISSSPHRRPIHTVSSCTRAGLCA